MGKEAGRKRATESLRANLMRGLGYIARDPEVQSLARQLADQALDDPPSVDHDLALEAFAVAAYNGDAAFYDRVMARLKTAKTPEEQFVYQRTLALFNEPKLLEKTLEYAVSSETRSQDSLYIVSRVMRNPAGEKLTWDFVRMQWANIERLGGPFAGGIIVNAAGSFCDSEMRDEVKDFFATHPEPAAERTLKQTLERINYCVDLRAQQGTQLTSWLQHQSSPGD